MKKTFLIFLAIAALLLPGFSLGGITSPLATPTAEAAPATGLRVTALSCLPGNRVHLEVAWNPSGHGVQWVDLSLFNNGFAPGTFLGAGPLSPGQSFLIWDGLLPGVPHFLRVNTASPEGWTPTQTLTFNTPSCTGFSGATGLHVDNQSCLSNGLVRANFDWNPSLQGAQFFDISVFNNGFAPGTFVGIGFLSPSQGSLTGDNITPNRTHYVRVNTLTPVGWIPSQTLSFTTRDCDAPDDDFTTSPVIIEGDAEPTEPAILTDVRIGSHAADGFDRIVFEFEGELPTQTRIRYESAAIRCGSGMIEDVDGSGTLIVRMTSTQAHDESGMLTVDDLEVAGTSGSIREAVSICDFEGIVEWAVGTNGTPAYRVTTLSNPSRIVIDVLR